MFVQQVEGVGQSDDPKERQQAVQGRGLKPVQPVVEEQQYARQRELRDQLCRRLDREDIVHQPCTEHQRRAHHEYRLRTNDPEHRRAEEQDGKDSHAPKQRDGARDASDLRADARRSPDASR
jgi:hypothetical protein